MRVGVHASIISGRFTEGGDLLPMMSNLGRECNEQRGRCDEDGVSGYLVKPKL